MCVLATEGGAEAEAEAEVAAAAEAEAEAEAGVAAGLAEVEAGREVSEGSAARDFRDGPLEQLRLELQAAHVT